MLKKIKSISFVICVVMVFTAQTNRPDEKEKGQRHDQVTHNNQSRPQDQGRREAPHNNQPRPQDQTRREAPNPVDHRQPTGRPFMSQPSYQGWQAPRVYAVPAPAPVENNRFFHRQHHKNWQPRYNFYDYEYHFYPYVNIASLVELTVDCASVGFDGQMYYYDQGTFYQQDEQGQYVAVAPPIGIIISALPANAGQISVNGQIYWRYKGIFYVQGAQGFQVVAPVQPVPADA